MAASRILRGMKEGGLAGCTLLGRFSRRTDGCLGMELPALSLLLLELNYCSLPRRFPHP